jgi:hypothetical protein
LDDYEQITFGVPIMLTILQHKTKKCNCCCANPDFINSQVGPTCKSTRLNLQSSNEFRKGFQRAIGYALPNIANLPGPNDPESFLGFGCGSEIRWSQQPVKINGLLFRRPDELPRRPD